MPEKVTMIRQSELDGLRACSAKLKSALELCLEAMGDSNPIHDDYWRAYEAGEKALRMAEGKQP